MQKRRTVSFLTAVMLLAATLCNTVPLDAFATPLAETAEVSGEADKADAIKKLPGVDNADGNARGTSDDADTDSMDEENAAVEMDTAANGDGFGESGSDEAAADDSADADGDETAAEDGAGRRVHRCGGGQGRVPCRLRACGAEN